MTYDTEYIPREEMDSTWCVWCCHAHESGQRCGASYMKLEGEVNADECGCDADHHPEPA